MTGRRDRRRKQLLDDLKERRRYWEYERRRYWEYERRRYWEYEREDIGNMKGEDIGNMKGEDIGNMKDETLVLAVWRSRFGKGSGSAVRQATECMI